MGCLQSANSRESIVSSCGTVHPDLCAFDRPKRQLAYCSMYLSNTRAILAGATIQKDVVSRLVLASRVFPQKLSTTEYSSPRGDLKVGDPSEPAVRGSCHRLANSRCNSRYRLALQNVSKPFTYYTLK